MAQKKYGAGKSKAEWDMMMAMCDAGLMQGIKSEYKGIEGRRFRFDFAWPGEKLALEVEGVVWRGRGRHQTASGMQNDCEKYALALLGGWRVLRVVPKQVADGSAVTWIKQLRGRAN